MAFKQILLIFIILKILIQTECLSESEFAEF